MYGEITSYRRDIGVGIVHGEDGRKYRFLRGSLVNARENLTGLEVDFEISGLLATDIIVLEGSPWAVFGMPSKAQLSSRFESESVMIFRAAA